MTDPSELLRGIVERRRESAGRPDDYRALLGVLTLVQERRETRALPWVIELWCSRPKGGGLLDRLVEIAAQLHAWNTRKAMGEAVAEESSFSRFAAAFDDDLLRETGGVAYACAVLGAFSFVAIDDGDGKLRDAKFAHPGVVDALGRAEWIRLLAAFRDHEDLGDQARWALQLVPSDRVPDLPPAPRAAPAKALGDALSRYLAGEREASWQSLCDLGPLGPDAREEARAVATEIMKVVRYIAETVAEALRAAGYPFVREPLADPETNREPLERLAARVGGRPPASLEVFWELVGGVDFCRAEDETVCDLDVDFHDFLVSNALQVSTIDDAWYCIDEWAETERTTAYIDFEISADEFHKEWTSGGPPYAIRIPSARADGRVLREPHHLDFVPYLRRNFEHCGFLGYEFNGESEPYRRLLQRVKHRLVRF